MNVAAAAVKHAGDTGGHRLEHDSCKTLLDAVLTVAYFSYANRLVMGLGLMLEPGFEATCRPDVPEL